MRPFTALLLALLAPASAAGATVAVDFTAPNAGPHWFVDSLEQLVGSELARFHRNTLVDKLDTHLCLNRDPACILELYRARGVEVVVLGALRDQRLEYEVYATSTHARPQRGSLALAGVSRSRLQQSLGEIVRPVLQNSDLLEKRPAAPGAASAVAPDQPALLDFAPLCALALLLILLWPIGLLRLLVDRRTLTGHQRPSSWKWSAGLGLVICLALVAERLGLLREAQGRLPIDLVVPLQKARALLFPLIGGLLWGAFVLAHFSWVFAPVEGLSRIRHDALWPFLKAWLAYTLLRASLLLFYVPLLTLTLLATGAAQLDDWLTWVLVVPGAGLLAVFWFHSLVDNVATYLDQALVVGQCTSRNPWHATIRRYFFGYLRRGKLGLDRKVLERALFLPGKLPGVVVYGGGFARPRILVGQQALELALGELPDEPEAPERTVNPEELPWGFLVPRAEDEPGTHAPGRTADALDARRRALVHAPPRPREPKPRLIGENATALGWVVPFPRDETMPLISNSREDFEVVKSLLSEHYGAFETGLEDDYDDTDPTQKDFLFGALVTAVGAFTRHDGLLPTLQLAIATGRPRASWLSRALLALAAAVYTRFFSLPAAAVADGYAALNQALHPAIQYLYQLRGGDLDLLTARADSPRLVATSKKILEKLDQERIRGDDRQLFNATPGNRMRWLSGYFSASLAARRSRRMLGSLLVAMLLLTLGALAAVDAMNYHPVYVERMSQMLQKATAVSTGAPDARPQER